MDIRILSLLLALVLAVSCCSCGSSSTLLTVDGNIITSRGLGTALDFALTLIEELIDKETADKLAAAVVYI